MLLPNSFSVSSRAFPATPPPRLDRKVGLTLRHDLLVGIGVLDDEVAGIARKKNGLDGPRRATPDGDHFGDVNEMVFKAMSTIETGHFGLFNNPLKIPIIAVTQYSRKVAA